MYAYIYIYACVYTHIPHIHTYLPYVYIYKLYICLYIYTHIYMCMVMDFPGGSEVKASASNVGDPGSIPGSGRSPGEGNGNPLQYSCLENPMDGGAW